MKTKAKALLALLPFLIYMMKAALRWPKRNRPRPPSGGSGTGPRYRLTPKGQALATALDPTVSVEVESIVLTVEANGGRWKLGRLVNGVEITLAALLDYEDTLALAEDFAQAYRQFYACPVTVEDVTKQAALL